ncbi:hypothetical protein BD311DRAFT_762008 [Dichomitus squalens]|uniref:Uncharacterized protein n=1 Tax=Dichomitus squalens TaxID=114155 RepID=A0A4Q9MH42_9APHY|nr:hypothetical protein BD311DRAFT_762008 [Dichomitus squalens]
MRHELKCPVTAPPWHGDSCRMGPCAHLSPCRLLISMLSSLLKPLFCTFLHVHTRLPGLKTHQGVDAKASDGRHKRRFYHLYYGRTALRQILVFSRISSVVTYRTSIGCLRSLAPDQPAKSCLSNHERTFSDSSHCLRSRSWWREQLQSP